jgi:hypothetical protein
MKSSTSISDFMKSDEAGGDLTEPGHAVKTITISMP